MNRIQINPHRHTQEPIYAEHDRVRVILDGVKTPAGNCADWIDVIVDDSGQITLRGVEPLVVEPHSSNQIRVAVRSASARR